LYNDLVSHGGWRTKGQRVFRSEQAALAAAYEKLYAKTSGGYSVAYSV